MRTKKLIKFIDEVGIRLDNYEPESVQNLGYYAEFVCTKEDVRAMQSAFSCMRHAIRDNDTEDPDDFIVRMLSVHSVLKITLSIAEDTDTEDTEGEDTDD